MNKIKINGIILEYHIAERFNEVKNHIEMNSREEVPNEVIARILIDIGINNYKFL